MKLPFNIYNAYVATTVSYGIVRKSIQMRNATECHYDAIKNETIRTPILMCDKVLIIGCSGIASLYCWPYFMYKDLRKYEVNAKNLNKAWYYTEDKHLSDYLFS